MVRGWARFDYDGVDTLVEAGDCVNQRPGILHSLYDWSDDMEFMEIIIAGRFRNDRDHPVGDRRGRTAHCGSLSGLAVNRWRK
jgi:hypothetical protein